MRIRINLLSLLRTLLKIAQTVQTVGEIVLATQGQRASDSPELLDLDAVRERAAGGAAGGGAGGGGGNGPALNPNDPSSARAG